MSNHYVEVVRGDMNKDNTGYMLKIVGIHVTQSKTKPEPKFGGDAVLPVSEFHFNLLSVSRGSIADLKIAISQLESMFCIEKDN